MPLWSFYYLNWIRHYKTLDNISPCRYIDFKPSAWAFQFSCYSFQVDLKNADPDKVATQIEALFGFDTKDILKVCKTV